MTTYLGIVPFTVGWALLHQLITTTPIDMPIVQSNLGNSLMMAFLSEDQSIVRLTIKSKYHTFLLSNLYIETLNPSIWDWDCLVTGLLKGMIKSYCLLFQDPTFLTGIITERKEIKPRRLYAEKKGLMWGHSKFSHLQTSESGLGKCKYL
jgi:hypothetical protein